MHEYSRSKLREILTKYQRELETNKSRILDRTQVRIRRKQRNNKVHVIQMAKLENEDEDASVNVKITTPTLYFANKNDGELQLDNTKKYDNNVLSVIERKTEVLEELDRVEEQPQQHTIQREQEQEQEQEPALDYRNLDIFHRAVYPILFLGQCFAIMPIVGVRQPNPKHMYFSMKSVPAVVTLMFLAASSVLSFSMIKHLSIIGLTAKNLVGVVFFGTVQFSCFLFLSLATRWPRMMRQWTRVELIFIRAPYEAPKRKLAKRVRSAAAMIIILSIVEHVFYLCSAIISYRRKELICSAQLNRTMQMTFEEYIQRNYDYVFALVPYSMFIGVYILVINAACTFIWNYMDLFIMMVSKGIAYRFEQITQRINKLADKEVPESTFVEIREHYVKMCEQLENIDENLSGIILLSCMNNLYFVCYQLLNIFNKLRWPINYIYFWYSLLYLIGRTAFVFLSAASINDQSKGALSVLRRVSNRTWCVEVERLIFQMTTQTVALSGKKFYFLTRSLLFGMAGTIVTYELVLLQFDEPNRKKGLPDICD